MLADGWSVVAHVHHEGDAVPDGAVKAVADLVEPASADRIFEAANRLPPVRLLVNNAARFAWDGFGEFDTGEFDAHMAVNVRAPALLIERFAREQDGTSDTLVVNLSLSGHFRPFAIGSLYLSDAAFYVSVTLLTLFLSIRALAWR